MLLYCVNALKGLKYKSVLTAHQEELQENTEQKQRQVHTDGEAETDTYTGADQTESSFTSGTDSSPGEGSLLHSRVS